MNRMLQLEKGSFVPLVFTTTGEMAPEAKRFISQVMCNIRTRLSMDTMRNVLVAVRGIHGKAKAWTALISNVKCLVQPDTRGEDLRGT